MKAAAPGEDDGLSGAAECNASGAGSSTGLAMLLPLVAFGLRRRRG